MKYILKKLFPNIVHKFYNATRLYFRNLINARKSRQEVFSEIYRKGLWGVRGKFCSGSGTVDERIISPYIQMITERLKEMGAVKLVDLGCGDFYVGSRIAPFCEHYIGVDVVPELIEHLNREFGSEKIAFSCVDIVSSPVPDGDICLIRQVMQHLSNNEILSIIEKIKKFKEIYVTEHVPAVCQSEFRNKDIVHGSGTRLSQNSGVYLEDLDVVKKFFDAIEVLSLDVKSHETHLGKTIIRTVRLSAKGGEIV